VVDPNALLAESFALAKRIAANDALAVQLTKKAINRSAEMGGLRSALEAALEVDMHIETTETPESREFNAIMQSDGLKAALDWRAGKSAGY
jgi:enoyl-CoA hydratase